MPENGEHSQGERRIILQMQTCSHLKSILN